MSSLQQTSHPLHHELPRLGTPGPGNGLPDKLASKAAKVQTGWSDVGKLYDHLAEAPKPADVDLTPEEASYWKNNQKSAGGGLSRPLTKRMKLVATTEVARRTIAAADAEIALRGKLAEVLSEADSHRADVHKANAAEFDRLFAEAQRRIAERDFEVMPAGPLHCGPVRKASETADQSRITAEAAQRNVRTNFDAVDRLTNLVDAAKRELETFEKSLAKLAA